MMKKIFHFIKYNNLFTVAVVFVMVGSGVSLAATPDVRAGILSSSDTVRSIDNTYLIRADIAHHNFDLRVTNVTEDADNYYVDYSYSTIALQDYVWKDAMLVKRLTVAKEALGNKDLGVFVETQLGQMIDSELIYLKEAQKIEKAKGATQKIISTQYAGLIGSMMSPGEKVFQGYVPVKPPEIDAVASVVVTDLQPEDQRSKSVPGGTKTKEQLEKEALQAQKDALAKQVEDLLNAQKDQSTSTPEVIISTSTPVVTPPVDTGDTSGSTTPPVVVPDPASGSGGTSSDTTPPTDPANSSPSSSTDTTPSSNQGAPASNSTDTTSSSASQTSSDTTPSAVVNGTP